MFNLFGPPPKRATLVELGFLLAAVFGVVGTCWYTTLPNASRDELEELARRLFGRPVAELPPAQATQLRQIYQRQLMP